MDDVRAALAAIVPALLAAISGYVLWQYRQKSQQLVSIESDRDERLVEGQRIGL